MKRLRQFIKNLIYLASVDLDAKFHPTVSFKEFNQVKKKIEKLESK